ncbi:MAG TPA: RING finger protein [Planctomycetota bacterium]|nr:RING finger protein [Planctomycetota bacterium]
MRDHGTWLLIRFGLILVMTIIGSILEPGRRRTLNRHLGTVARRLQGFHRPKRRDYDGAVSWKIEGIDGLLFMTGDGASRTDGATVRFNRACPFRLRVFPETQWSAIRKFLGARDLQTGDSGFDRTFMVQTSNESGARAVLTREVRGSMMRLTGVGVVSLELGPMGILLRCRHDFADDPGRLTEFAAEALTLGKALLQALDPGIVITDIEVSGPGTCPVCATAVEDDRGLCARCKTPHHKVCWKYLGGCAVFACAGRPRRMRSLQGRRPVRAA